jgi:hypothetical protein
VGDARRQRRLHGAQVRKLIARQNRGETITAAEALRVCPFQTLLSALDQAILERF